MATTTNFGWETPDDTDLVKDGAAAIRTLGSAIDTSLVDLKGGTTGQVLSKTSNTDMDFTWVTSDDANAIQNAIVDAKGDLIAASAADTPARLAVGNNGETLVADSSASTGLRWQGNFAAGKNKLINADFYWNQRGFTSTTTAGSYGFDRWTLAGATDGTTTMSAQTFTAGAAPLSGYEAVNFLRVQTTGQTLSSAASTFTQRIEDVRTVTPSATWTVSFWAKAASGTPKVAVELAQNFGSGGSAQVNNYLGQVTLSTSWTRYSLTITMPSISGKTIGSGSLVNTTFWLSAGSNFDARTGSLGIQTNTFDFWGIQVEAGNVATAFQTATGTLAGELAAAQRYYQRVTSDVAYGMIATGKGYSTGVVQVTMPLKVTMRTTPTAIDTSAASTFIANTGATDVTSITSISINANLTNKDIVGIDVSKTSAFTVGAFYFLYANNASTSYIGVTAEL